jgi:hypothetical protein
MPRGRFNPLPTIIVMFPPSVNLRMLPRVLLM